MEIKIAQINCIICVRTILIISNTTVNLKLNLVWYFDVQNVFVECMNNELPHINNLFHSDSESENKISDVKDKSNPNDVDSIVVIFNENGEEVEDIMHDNTEHTISDNNEDEKDKKEDNIIEKSNVPQKMSVLSVVYEARFLKQI